MMVEDVMKKSKLVSFLMICIFSTMVTGCKKEEETLVSVEVEAEEENMFGLTADEQKMYAEYAAGVLMKYNAGSNLRLLEGQKLTNEMAAEERQREQAAKRAQAVAEYEAGKSQGNKKDNESQTGSSSASSQSSGVNYITDMSKAVDINAFTITYAGYEVSDSYPSSGEDVLLAVDAAQGKDLLITKFLVSNISGQTEHFDMFSKQAKYKLNLGGTAYKSQYTLLLDDLSMYKGDVDAGAVIETVLIFEIPESAASSLDEMVLSVTAGDGVSSMKLQGGSVSISEVAQPIDLEQDVEEEHGDFVEEDSDILQTESENESDESGSVTVVGSDSN